MPAASASGVAQRRDGRPARQRRDHDRGDQHRGRQPVDAARALATAWRRGRRARCTARTARRWRTRTRRRAARGRTGRRSRDRPRARRARARRRCGACATPSAARPTTGRNSIAATRRERLPVDREVEAAVHQRQDAPPGQQQPPAAAIEAGERAPGAAPAREDQRGRDDAQPGHAEHVDAREQQHGERRAEVVEDRADDEVAVRWHAPAGAPLQCRKAYVPIVHRLFDGRLVAMTSNQREIGHSTDGARSTTPICRLLAELQDDARLSLAELGRRVGLSSPAVAERLQRLEEQGCITGLPHGGRPAGARLRPQRRGARAPGVAAAAARGRDRARERRGRRMPPHHRARTASS